MVVIVVAGIGLVVYSRNELLHPAVVGPTATDNWQVAFAADICGTVQGDLPANSNLTSVGIRTFGNGLIDVDPGVVTTNPAENLVSVLKSNGQQVTYDPSRLHGIAAYREIEREFATGDKIQFTAPSSDLQVANRDLGTIQHIGDDGKISVRMDGAKERTVRFDASEMRHFDHGYAVTSHSSQGLTSERVIVNMDTEVHPELISSRFAYVSVSRASHDAQIYTNDAASLTGKLSHAVSKSAAVSFGNAQGSSSQQGFALAIR